VEAVDAKVTRIIPLTQQEIEAQEQDDDDDDEVEPEDEDMVMLRVNPAEDVKREKGSTCRARAGRPRCDSTPSRTWAASWACASSRTSCVPSFSKDMSSRLRYRVNDDRPAGAAFTWRYAELRMIKCQNKALDNLRDGLLDVIPARGLEGLTAEDLRLLLNGVGDINVSTLISYTSFNDESGETPDRLVSFKRWLWAVIEKMSSMEKQDLVYFWTGSPALPASEEGFQPMPSVTIGVQLAIKKSPWVGGGSK